MHLDWERCTYTFVSECYAQCNARTVLELDNGRGRDQTTNLVSFALFPSGLLGSASIPISSWATLSPCSGDTCAEDDAECAQLDPCLNGATCVDLPNNYTCECPEKYNGRHCELDLDMYVELLVAEMKKMLWPLLLTDLLLCGSDLPSCLDVCLSSEMCFVLNTY